MNRRLSGENLIEKGPRHPHLHLGFVSRPIVPTELSSKAMNAGSSVSGLAWLILDAIESTCCSTG
jgi:hypothetical protein